MKKILFLLLGIILLVSCGQSHRGVAIERASSTGKYLEINGCEYYKVNILGHDAYQYTFSTYCGKGSGILHIEELCEKCKTKEK